MNLVKHAQSNLPACTGLMFIYPGGQLYRELFGKRLSYVLLCCNPEKYTNNSVCQQLPLSLMLGNWSYLICVFTGKLRYLCVLLWNHHNTQLYDYLNGTTFEWQVKKYNFFGAVTNFESQVGRTCPLFNSLFLLNNFRKGSRTMMEKERNLDWVKH